jgi:hypothetical protein
MSKLLLPHVGDQYRDNPGAIIEIMEVFLTKRLVKAKLIQPARGLNIYGYMRDRTDTFFTQELLKKDGVLSFEDLRQGTKIGV